MKKIRKHYRKIPNRTVVASFKNKRKTWIQLYHDLDKTGGIIMSFSVEARWRGKQGNGDSMPITLEALLETFCDFNNITKNVLKKDKVARRWFRRLVKNTVIDEVGTRMGDFILPNGQLDYNKIQAYENIAWNKVLKDYDNKKKT